MLNFSQINSSMIEHLFKLVWNRKRANALIIIELLAAFLVLVGVCATIIHYTRLYVQPLGYEYKDTWNILANRKNLANEPVSNSGGIDRTSKTAQFQSAQSIISTLKAQPDVESCGFLAATPFSFEHNLTEFNRGEKYRTEQLRATDNIRDVLNLTITEGRWFNATDDQYNGTTGTVKPIVINQVAAKLFFGKESPIGKDISYQAGEGIPQDLARMRYRVVGVISDFRRGSEFDQSNSLLFHRVSFLDTTAWIPSQLLVKMKSSIDAGYEEKLLATLQRTAPDWDFQISTLETDRAKKHRIFAISTGVGMTIAAFLLLMVALGLVGVVWQSVMRRMRELGVRRAFGATRGDVMFFIIGELAALTTFAVVLGFFVLAQFPFISFFDIPMGTYIMSVGAASVALYALTALCALYPSRLAGTVQPSDALRYE